MRNLIIVQHFDITEPQRRARKGIPILNYDGNSHIVRPCNIEYRGGGGPLGKPLVSEKNQYENTNDIQGKRTCSPFRKHVDNRQTSCTPSLWKRFSGERCLPLEDKLESRQGSMVVLKSPQINSWPYLTKEMSLKILRKNLSLWELGAIIVTMVYGCELRSPVIIIYPYPIKKS